MRCKPLLFAALALAACERPGPAAPAPADNAPAGPLALETPAPKPPSAAPAPPQEQASDDWRKYARPDDVDRLGRLEGAWKAGLEGANASGHAKELAALGPVADPDARALPNPHPAPGLYRCRTIKMGGLAGFVSYPWFRCRVELTPGGDLTFEKLTGSQRGAGKFYPGADTRLVYLGGQAWGLDEKTASAYGQAPERDQIGVLERVGETRWRLVLPWPRVESDLDIVEIAR